MNRFWNVSRDNFPIEGQTAKKNESHKEPRGNWNFAALLQKAINKRGVNQTAGLVQLLVGQIFLTSYHTHPHALS